MAKIRVLSYTELEFDTDSGKSRVLKHWSKQLNGTYEKKRNKPNKPLRSGKVYEEEI